MPGDPVPGVAGPGDSGLAITVHRFHDLDPSTAYALWRLRQQVFVVEQDCPYPDLDGRDDEPGTRHVLLHRDGRLAGCLRILTDPEPEPNTARIGRVALAGEHRGQGLSEPLIRAALEVVGDRVCVLDAQSGLHDFYAGFGFRLNGEEFSEDGIAHLPMRRG